MKSSQRIKRVLNKYQRKPITQQGILGNEVGVLAVPNRTDYVYVRIAGMNALPVYNKRVPLILDLPVDVGYDPLEPKNFQVLNIHRYPQGGGRGLVDVATILHGKTHNWAGIDPVYIEKRQLMPLRPTPMGGMNLYVTREVTYYDDNAVVVTGQQLNLASYVPATGSWLVLIYKDTDELIKVSTGGVLKDIFTLSLSDAPQAYPGTVPIALIRLYGGQSGIAEGYNDTDIIDVRQLFSPIDLTGTGGAGGGHVIQDEGVSRTQRTNLNFKGALVWANDNAGADSTDIIISGSSSAYPTGTTYPHDHSGDVGDGGQFPLVNLQSAGATNGQVPLADGAGGIDWGDQLNGDPRRYLAAYNYVLSGTAYRIGLAESSDLRTWVIETEPIIDTGAGGSWDVNGVKDPWIIEDNKGILYCYYSGYIGTGPFTFCIGLSRSFDKGVTWTKYASNPVISAVETWEGTSVRRPVVFYDIEEADSSKRFKMWYINDADWNVGYAYSADGLTWTKYASNPIGLFGLSGVALREGVWIFFTGGGYATASAPEGPLSSTTNFWVSGDSIGSALTANVNIGNTSIAVVSSAGFVIGMPVWIADSNNHYLTHVVSKPDGTHIVVGDAAPVQITTADSGEVRSIAYRIGGGNGALYDDGWIIPYTVMQPWNDGGANLKELCLLGYVEDDLSVGYVDYGNGLMIPVTLAESRGAQVSRENPVILDLWEIDRRQQPKNPAPITVTDTATIDLTLTGADLTAALRNTAVVPGSYANVDVTVDAQGRITAISDGAVIELLMEDGVELPPVPLTVDDGSDWIYGA